MSLSLSNLHKRYGSTEAVAGVSLAVGDGETLALLGPSGCGKSTLLRLIAGLEPPDRGRVSLGDRDVTSEPPQQRRFGVVFQDFALFPHLDVAGNIAFGLVEQGLSRVKREARVAELLRLVGLSGFQGRKVHQLSGGQQQRVALARAVAPRPRVLLLDEPLSNLDEALRNELKQEIVRLLDELSIEAVYVTHDQAEAFAVADKVAVMREGRIVQLGDRERLLEQPADAWTARFLGHDNVWTGEAARRVTTALATRVAAPPKLRPGEALLLRADLVDLAPATAEPPGRESTTAGAAGAIDVTLTRAEREGLTWHLTLDAPTLGTAIEWRGHTRELLRRAPASGSHSAALPTKGAAYRLFAPPTAWRVIAEGVV